MGRSVYDGYFELLAAVVERAKRDAAGVTSPTAYKEEQAWAIQQEAQQFLEGVCPSLADLALPEIPRTRQRVA